MRRVLSLVIAVLGSMVVMNAQDIHFSQFHSSPLNLNPALTGNMSHEQRVTLNYRSQWASFLGKDAYNTISASYDRQFATGQEDRFGLGGVIYADQAGEARLSTIFGSANGSYSRKIMGDRSSAHYLTGGASIGFGQRALNTDNLRWASQFNTNGAEVPTVNNTSTTFLDLGGGLFWYSAFNKSSNAYIGVSGTHLNEPEVNFLNGVPYNLNRRISIHAGGQFPIVNQFSLVPAGIYITQGDAKEIMLGTAARFLLGPGFDDEQAFEIGAYARIVENVVGVDTESQTTSQGLESLVVTAGLAFTDFKIGVSYDYNLSDLSGVSRSNGAFELSVQYFINDGVSSAINSPQF